jgi:hypothetical protein
MYSIPVTLVEEDGRRWLVAPYGEVNWVRNARAAGRVMLSRGRHTEIVRIVELGAQEGAPVLKRYVTEVPITRPFRDVGPRGHLPHITSTIHEGKRPGTLCPWPLALPAYADRLAMKP